MTTIRLRVPPQTLTGSLFIDPRPRPLQAWLDALPRANVQETARLLQTALRDLAQLRIPHDQRDRALALFHDPVQSVTDMLRRRYQDAPSPLAPRERAMANLVRQIYIHMADAHKAIVSGLLAERKPVGPGHRIYVTALAHALDYLGRQLLEAYVTYEADPEAVWGEVHQLWVLAEHTGVQVTPVGEREPEPTIEHRYKRILLLGLADPYRLMPGECAKVYADLARWSDACRILPLGRGQSPVGHCFVDLAADGPPHYASAGTRFQPIDARLVDTQGLLRRLRDELAAYTPPESKDRTKAKVRPTTLAQRLERDRLLRLSQAWGRRAERLTQRASRLADILLVAGLSNVHRLLLEGGNAVGVAASLHRTPATFPAQPPPGSPPPVEGLGDLDGLQALLRAALSQDDDPAQQQDLPEASVSAIPWRQRNQSAGGVALFCFMDCQTQVRVGEVVAFRSGELAEREWHIGLVRWVRVRPHQGIELGIRTLAEDGGALETRAVEGTGRGGDFVKGLVIPNVDPTVQPATLLTQPAIYDEGTLLEVRQEERVFTARLTQLVDSSSSYSLFRFTLDEEA